MGLRNIGPGLCYSAATILPVVCGILVALRFYCRRTRGINIGWDDWMVLPGLVFLIGMSIAIIIGVALHGVAYSPPPTENGINAPSKQLTMARQIIFAIDLLGPTSLTCVKVSFVLWYRRLFWKGSMRWYRILLTSVTVLLIMWGITFFGAFLFMCKTHPSVYWSTTADVLARCASTTTIYEAYATSDTMLDIAIFLLPIIPLYRLQMSLGRRLGVSGIFMLGALTIVASILRMVVVFDVTQNEFKPDTNVPLLLTSGMYWGLIETGVGLIACCLPSCAVLFQKKRGFKEEIIAKDYTRHDSNESDNTLFNTVASYRTVSAFDERNIPSYNSPGGIVVTKTYSTHPVDLELARISSMK